MKVLKIGFVGTRTDRPEAMVDFFERTLALRPMHGGDDMRAFRLPDGSIAEVFGPSQNEHALTTGPVVEFLVEDVAAATEELRARRRSDRARTPFEPRRWVWPGPTSGRRTAASTAVIEMDDRPPERCGVTTRDPDTGCADRSSA